MSVETGRGPVAFAGGVNTPDFLFPLIPGATTLTTQASADSFFAGSNGNIWKMDLLGVSQIRLTGRVTTVSASANSPKIQLRYSPTFTTTLASFIQLGEQSIEFSLFTGATLGDSGWINIAAAARVNDCHLALTMIGGDGAASPVVNNIFLAFR